MKKTLIMLAGGLSSRFQDLGDKPKCLLQLYDKSILQRLVEFFQKKEYSVILSLGHLSEEVISFKKKSNLYFAHRIESKPLGTAGAIKFASDGVESDNFIIINADTINNYSMLDEALFFHNERNHKITQLVTKQSNQNQGTILVEDNKVIGNHEYEESFDKPKNIKNSFSSTGAYIINKQYFDKIFKQYENKKTKEAGISLEKVIIKELTKRKEVNAFRIKSHVYDLGTVTRYRTFLDKYDQEVFQNKFLL
ncbi:MAG TPA: sugar phosphate nucleotidyltransferase [Ignavibacteria bacterium]|nr:sugar phosphate nucleotidyltransferase [Ignavibacteria bacterium]HMQ99053.1 sugar phosphate nucleotidyltransferase [Ignavibacteria bacterium]